MQAAPSASYAYGFASIYAELGDKDQVFAWLEKSYEARDGGALVEFDANPSSTIFIPTQDSNTC